MTSSFELAIAMISIRENPSFCFDKLDFLACTAVVVPLGINLTVGDFAVTGVPLFLFAFLVSV